MARREVEPLRISKETMRLYHYHLGIGSGKPYESVQRSSTQAAPEQINLTRENPNSFEKHYYEGELL